VPNHSFGHPLTCCEQGVPSFFLSGQTREKNFLSAYGNQYRQVRAISGNFSWRGTTWIAADIEAATGFGLTGNLRLLYLEKNTQANLVTTEHAPAEEEMAVAPISRELLIGLGAAYRFQDYLELSAEPVYHLKDGESWMELGLSARTWYDILVPRRSLR
jgi:hypothetical protein